MRRTKLFALMTALPLLLCACGKDTRADWQRWQEEQRNASEIRFSAEICSLTETDAVRFGAQVSAVGDTVTMTLTAPETLRGLRLVTDGAGARLQVEEMDLSLTALRHDTLPPAEAGAILLAALRDGYILWTADGNDALRAAFSGPGDETVTLWRALSGEPVAAELARGEKTELRLTITDWQTKEQPWTNE